jgi:hypothetical protein
MHATGIQKKSQEKIELQIIQGQIPLYGDL